MSVRITHWVWENSNASGNDLLLLLALADQADDNGRCWPSHAHLANKTKLSRRTVQRHLSRLIDEGVVLRKSAQKGSSNIYEFVLGQPVQARQTDAGSVTPLRQDDQRQTDLRQNDAPSPVAQGVRHLGGAGGASPSGALTVNEPLMNRQKRASAPKRATQLPDEFSFDDVRAWTIESKLPVGPNDFEQFRDYHTAKGSTFKNWEAAWRNWARNAEKFGNTRPRKAAGDNFGGAAYGVFQ